MNFKNEIISNSPLKYDLTNETVSAAASGMHPTTNLDERCVSFTIHLSDALGHSALMRVLFDTSEAFFAKMNIKRRSASHCGLASFLDANGSKFTGADRDASKVHCHGFLLIPYHISSEHVEKLISRLTIAARSFVYEGYSAIRTTPGAIQFASFDRYRPGKSLMNWVGYAQKDVVKSKLPCELGVILPFDIREEYGHLVATKIEGKRDQILGILSSSDCFKVFKLPKCCSLPKLAVEAQNHEENQTSHHARHLGTLEDYNCCSCVENLIQFDKTGRTLKRFSSQEKRAGYGKAGSIILADNGPNTGLVDGLTRNAIASLRMGVEDYKSNDADRQLSAVRNFSAGTLLLGKACLLSAAPPEADPMVVLGQKLTIGMEDGKLATKVVGRATIDVTQLKQRFKDFGLPPPRGDLDRLTFLRNAIEHLHTDQGPQQVKEAIAACFPTVLGFFELLGRSPMEDLGDAWKTMQALEDFQQQEAARCAESFSAIDWPDGFSIKPECSKCKSALIVQRDQANADHMSMELRCLACGAEYQDYRAVAVLVNGAFGKSMLRAAYDGEPGPVYDCPECGHSLYVANGQLDVCLYCQHQVTGECNVCGETLDVSNVAWDDHSLCSYHEYRAYKDRDR